LTGSAQHTLLDTLIPETNLICACPAAYVIAVSTAHDRYVIQPVISVGPLVRLAVLADSFLHLAAFRELAGCPALLVEDDVEDILALRRAAPLSLGHWTLVRERPQVAFQRAPQIRSFAVCQDEASMHVHS